MGFRDKQEIVKYGSGGLWRVFQRLHTAGVGQLCWLAAEGLQKSTNEAMESKANLISSHTLVFIAVYVDFRRSRR